MQENTHFLSLSLFSYCLFKYTLSVARLSSVDRTGDTDKRDDTEDYLSLLSCVQVTRDCQVFLCYLALCITYVLYNIDYLHVLSAFSHTAHQVVACEDFPVLELTVGAELSD